MAESGDSDLVGQSLAQARMINDKHPNDIIGLKAKAVLKDILEIQSDMVDGALLYEVGKGDYQSREYELALMNFKRAYAAPTDHFGLNHFAPMRAAVASSSMPKASRSGRSS